MARHLAVIAAAVVLSALSGCRDRPIAFVMAVNDQWVPAASVTVRVSADTAAARSVLASCAAANAAMIAQMQSGQFTFARDTAFARPMDEAARLTFRSAPARSLDAGGHLAGDLQAPAIVAALSANGTVLYGAILPADTLVRLRPAENPLDGRQVCRALAA